MRMFGPGRTLLWCGAAAIATTATASLAQAQDISINYEHLSSMEEPLATEIGDVTLVLNGLIDTPVMLDLEEEEEDDAAEAGLIGNMQVTALVQLQNRWRVNAAYFGQYETDEALSSATDENYTDNAAISVRGMWGAVVAGNVSGVVREGTRRRRGTGNGQLAFDDVLGRHTEWGGGYTGRFGPWVVGAIMDEDGQLDVGATFQRPIDDTDYRLTARFSEGTYAPGPGSPAFESRAIGAVGEVVYGSTTFDVGLGYERLSSSAADADRPYVSAGVRSKTGVLGWSLEAHYGRIEGEGESSYALGVQYDVARGLSANLGLNHARAGMDAAGIRPTDTRDTRAVFSLRYSF